MTMRIKTKMVLEESSEPHKWLVRVEAYWPDGEQHFTFTLKHRHADLTVLELQRSAIAQLRTELGHILAPDTLL